MKKLLLAVALSLSVSGCAAVSAISAVSSITNVGNHVVVRGTQALIVAEYAYNSAGTVVLEGLRSGLIKGANATRVRELNMTATSALIAGKNAQGDAEKAKYAATVMDAVTGIRAITGK